MIAKLSVIYKICGFSLIEVSIIIAITAIILGFKLELSEYLTYQSDIEDTILKLNKIKSNIIATRKEGNNTALLKDIYYFDDYLLIGSLDRELLNLEEGDIYDAWDKKILLMQKKSKNLHNIALLCNLDFNQITYKEINKKYFIDEFADNKNCHVKNTYLFRPYIIKERFALSNANKIYFTGNNYLELNHIVNNPYNISLNLKFLKEGKQIIYKISNNLHREILYYKSGNFCYEIISGSQYDLKCIKKNINYNENFTISFTRSQYRLENIYINNQWFKPQSLTITLAKSLNLILGDEIDGINGQINHLIINKDGDDSKIITEFLDNLWNKNLKLKINHIGENKTSYADYYLISYGKNQYGAFNKNNRQYFSSKKIEDSELENIADYKSDLNFNHLNYEELKKYPNGYNNYDDISIFFNIRN